MRIKITDRIEYIAASENPLSADVVFVKGNDSIWIFDVGESDEAYEAIAELLKDNQVNIILSHFHRDHMWNLERIAAIPTVDRCVNLYVSKHSYKYAKTGIIVEDDVVIDVLLKGYKLKDRVIRPASVKINKKEKGEMKDE